MRHQGEGKSRGHYPSSLVLYPCFLQEAGGSLRAGAWDGLPPRKRIMADHESTHLPPPSPEHRRVAAGQFERANQVLASGNHDYAIQLLLTCCKLDPANLVYRQALRRTEKIKFKNNLRGSRLAFLT